MQKLLSNVGARIYDQESKENIERLKGFLLQAKSQIMGQLYKLLEASDNWLETHGMPAECDGTIVCQSRDHVAKCYAYSATDKQWRNQMGKVLESAK